MGFAALGAVGITAWFGLERGASADIDPGVGQALGGVGVGALAAPSPAARPTSVPTESDLGQEAVASPDEPALDWNEEGFELLAEGDLEGAIERFEAASALWPEVDVYANNLAEALFRSAKARWDEDPKEALERLDRALSVLRDEARRDELTPLRDRWRRAREAEDGFWTESSPYFAVSFDGSRSELMDNVTAVLTDLDTFYSEFGEVFGRRPVEERGNKIRVVFYRRAAFDQVTGLGDWAGGVFDGTIRVPVGSFAQERERLRTVLRHELMHAFIQHIGGGNAPAWLNEGLAQWIERPGQGRQLDVALARGRLRGQTLFPLTELRGSLAAWSDKDAIARAYAQALVLVDHLAFTKGERLLIELVAASNELGSTGPEQRFLTRFPGFPLQEFADTIPR